MAPMAGLTTPALRRSVRRWGAGLVFTEMISAYGVHYDNRRTLDYFAHGEDEHPLGFQLFGADADVLADAAGRAVAAGADLVDLNMACPVRKVVKTGAGAALLADPDRAVSSGAGSVAPWLFGETLGATEPAPEEKLAEVRLFSAEALADLGARAVGHLRQFWPKFRRHGAIDKPLSLELMQARDEARIRVLLGV